MAECSTCKFALEIIEMYEKASEKFVDQDKIKREDTKKHYVLKKLKSIQNHKDNQALYQNAKLKILESKTSNSKYFKNDKSQFISYGIF